MRITIGSRVTLRSVAVLLAGIAAAGCGADTSTTGVVADSPVAAAAAPESATSGSRAGGMGDQDAARPQSVVLDADKMLNRPGETGSSWSSVEEYMDHVLLDVHGYWSDVQAQAGLPAPTVNYLWQTPGTVRDSVHCGQTDDRTMHYCPAQDAIVFSLAAATQLWDGTWVAADGKYAGDVVGDFAVAYIVAHEYAHNMQSEYGLRAALEARVDWGRLDEAGRADVQRRIGLALERHADCWAGSWASSAYYAGTLEQTDLDEAQLTAWVIADTRSDHERSHGSTEERPADFMFGYDSVDPLACDALLVQ